MAGLVALSVALFASLGCSGSKAGGGGWNTGPVPVTVAKVSQKAMPVSVRAIGNVEAYNSVSVKSLVAGQITEVHFSEGQTVKENDVLFVIDPRPYKVALAQAQAALARDKALVASARSNARRNKELVGKEYVTAQQAEDAEAQAASLEATVAADDAAVKLADLNLSYTTIKSPISGKAGAILIRLGNVIKEKDLPLVVINQIQPIYVDFTLPDIYLSQLLAHAHERLPVTAVPGARAAQGAVGTGAPQTGELTFVDNMVNTQTGTIALKAVFPNKDEALWPGQFVDATMTLGERSDAVVAPAQAIQTGQEGAYVFVVNPDQTVEPRLVTVGVSNEREAAIEKGLTPGETVVTDGQLRLVKGSRVQIKAGEGSGS